MSRKRLKPTCLSSNLQPTSKIIKNCLSIPSSFFILLFSSTGLDSLILYTFFFSLFSPLFYILPSVVFFLRPPSLNHFNFFPRGFQMGVSSPSLNHFNFLEVFKWAFPPLNQNQPSFFPRGLLNGLVSLFLFFIVLFFPFLLLQYKEFRHSLSCRYQRRYYTKLLIAVQTVRSLYYLFCMLFFLLIRKTMGLSYS